MTAINNHAAPAAPKIGCSSGIEGSEFAPGVFERIGDEMRFEVRGAAEGVGVLPHLPALMDPSQPICPRHRHRRRRRLALATNVS